MREHSGDFLPFKHRMTAAGLPPIFIETFAFYYEQVVAGETGMIPETGLRPVDSLPDVTQFPEEIRVAGEEALVRTAVIKLNGGLGTSMGLKQAKTLLPLKNDLSFLDILAQQAVQSQLPLVLMNSFNTDADSLLHLQKYPFLQQQNVPLSFLQHKAPKVTQHDFSPVQWPQDPDLEWCPPGHGDIYTALVTSGTLDALLSAGIEYAFVANADNLGAVIDPFILGYMAAHEIPFMMEVAERTQMDKKGGHLARRDDGQFILREAAQCPPDDKVAFQDIHKHKFFNTNNLWLHLPTLQQRLAAQDYNLRLPLILNEKTVDPRDEKSTAVYQLETAMGSAIALFSGAQAVRVPRTRFAPVKTTEDLLVIQSDRYRLTPDFRVVGDNGIVVTLDKRFYKLIFDLKRHFPDGPPSLQKCTNFSVEGEFFFGKDIICREEVYLENSSTLPVQIPDGAILSGPMVYK